MTDEQRDELRRDRMKTSQPEMVTVSRNDLILALKCSRRELRAEEAMAVYILRKAARLDQ